VVPSSFLCWILLLGSGYPISTAEPVIICCPFYSPVEIFLSSLALYVPSFFHDLMISIIAAEERALVQFFGQDYVEYRCRVGTKIPFIH